MKPTAHTTVSKAMPMNAKNAAVLRVMAGVYTDFLPFSPPFRGIFRVEIMEWWQRRPHPTALRWYVEASGSVAWNSLEALVSICAGLVAGSVSLVGFGLDSVIEVGSGAALLWRLHHDSFAGPPTKLLSARYHRDRLFCCLDPIHQNFDCR